MNQRINVTELPDFNVALYLDSLQTVAAYLTEILATGDTGLLAAALRDIVRARSACGW